MKIYIVQKRHWEYDDDFYRLEDCLPTRAFLAREDAEAFRVLWELAERENWQKANPTDIWFCGEKGPQPALEYPLFEVIETELHP